MVKKLIVLSGLAVAVGFIWRGTKFPEDVRSAFGKGGDRVVAWIDKKTSPKPDTPEAKLNALRGRLKDLDKEIADTKDKLAQQIVESGRMTNELGKVREEVDSTGKVLAARAKDIDKASSESAALVNYAGEELKLAAARKRLDRDLDLAAARKALLAQMEEADAERKAGVKVLTQHVAELETVKLEASTRLEKMGLELKSLRLSEVKDRFGAPDTKSGAFLADLDALEQDIEVKKVRRTLDPEKTAATPAPVAAPTESAADAVNRRLGLKADAPKPQPKIEKASD